MKNLFVLIVSVLVVFLASCTQSSVFSVSMEVTPMEVRNGDEITIALVKGEDTNVDFKAEVFWEDIKIGEILNQPYQLRYVVNGVEEGFYNIRALVSYKNKSGTMSSSSSFNLSRSIYVVNH